MSENLLGHENKPSNDLFDLEILRALFLVGKAEAFRERAQRIPSSIFEETTRGKSLQLIFLALIFKHETENEEELEAEVEKITKSAKSCLAQLDIDSESVSEVGLAQLMIGDIPAAKNSFIRATRIKPTSPYAHFRKGTLAALENDYDEALQELEKGLEILPTRAEAWANLAHVHRSLGNEKEAQAAYIKGWGLRPAFRGLAIKAIEALNDTKGLESYLGTVKAKYESPETAKELKAGLLAQWALLAEYNSDTQEKMARINEAVVFAEDDEEIRRLYVEMMLGENRYWILGNYLKTWTEKYDVLFEHMALVECRTQAGFLEMAKEGLLAVKERAFGDPEWDNAWAEILKEENKFSEAKEHLESVLTRHPDNVLIINQLADVLSSLGEIERAMELTQKASENAPGALIRLIENKKMPTEEDLERLEEWLERAVDEQVQMNIRFTMAHTQDKLKKYEAAAKTIYDANQSVWKKVNYKHEDFTKQIDDIIQGFDKRWVMAHRVEKIFDVQPIFIVGMPRSGTTLLEQIFAAHPRVFGGGELPFMSRIGTLSEKIQKKPFPEALLTASRDLLKDGAEYYINQAKKTLGFDEPVLVDKLPHNFMDAGLICAMFPNARVIGLRRDYRAIALSNYFQNFSAWRGTLGYAFNLEAMGHHLKDFHRLMNHWQQELPPEQYREFHYEDLAQNPSEAIPAVLEFCGLDFTPEIMEFYRNKTAVRTASIRQVRNPIYTGSIEKWRHYETLLKPVIDIVEGKI